MERCLRILVTADPLLPVPPVLYGGIERIIASLITELLGRGHEVALLAHRDSTVVTTETFAWPRASSGFLTHVKAMQTAIKTFQPDLIHSFSRLAYLLPVIASRALPKLMSFQRAPTPHTVRWANRFSLGSLTFTGCSDYISKKGKGGGGTWETIHNFVDLNSYTYSPQVAADAPLVFLSRVERIKGAHTAIAVCRKAGRRLIIAGNHVDDASENGRYWRDEIAPHLGHDEVEYIGPVNDAEKNELLGKAAAMIVPIEWEEPFGIVFAEALACGTPVISCPHGALPEIIETGRHGFLATDLDQLVASVKGIRNIDRAACRQRAESKFSSDVIVLEYARLYAERIASEIK